MHDFPKVTSRREMIIDMIKYHFFRHDQISFFSYAHMMATIMGINGLQISNDNAI